MVDEALAKSFEGIGAEYDRYRPGFPVAAVDAILPERVERVIDLGAGTGKLTAMLVERAAEVVAVEPSLAMLDVLRAKLPAVDAQIGTAERIPVGDAVADAVTVAQAFHWFDRDPACAEIARVLRPGGVLGLLWNRSDPDCAWDRACHAIIHPAVADVDDTAGSASEELPGFVLVRRKELRWTERITRDDYLGRWRTISSYLVASDEGRRAMMAGAEAVLDADAETRGRERFEVPHLTDVFVYRRL